MATYFLPYVIDADDAETAVRSMEFGAPDSPTDPITVDKLAELLNMTLGRYNREREALSRDGKRTQPATDAAVARIIGIVTLVPAVPAPATPSGLSRKEAALRLWGKSHGDSFPTSAEEYGDDVWIGANSAGIDDTYKVAGADIDRYLAEN